MKQNYKQTKIQESRFCLSDHAQPNDKYRLPKILREQTSEVSLLLTLAEQQQQQNTEDTQHSTYSLSCLYSTSSLSLSRVKFMISQRKMLFV